MTPVSVGWKTTNGTPKSGSDYAADNGAVTFPAGSTSRTIAVTVKSDTAVEVKEIFYVDLSAPSGATIADARARRWNRNDRLRRIRVSKIREWRQCDDHRDAQWWARRRNDGPVRDHERDGKRRH